MSRNGTRHVFGTHLSPVGLSRRHRRREYQCGVDSHSEPTRVQLGRGRLLRPLPGLAFPNYCNSFRTSCCCWFAWAREEMPVCSRIEYLVKFATADGMSAATIPFSAEVRFCTWLL